MRPVRSTPAHSTADLAELVCSNSLKSDLPHTASGMLKAEMRELGSVILAAAAVAAVPSGGALAVDRHVFAAEVTSRIVGHPGIQVVREEITEIPDDGPVVIATGPLTSDALAARIGALTGEDALYFYDAASPIINGESINREIAFEAARAGRGIDESRSGGYLNCPLDRETFERFRTELLAAELVPLRAFEEIRHFEGCLPIEEVARRGERTLQFGPMKPVGLSDPRTGRRPYAVVQLRQENLSGSLYSMVAFQTRLKWGEQTRVFRLIPGLEEAEFVRLGVMHRNTFINSPRLLDRTMELRSEVRARAGRRHPAHFAGCITGVEGYVESAATGILAGLNAARAALSLPPAEAPEESMLGALTTYVARGGTGAFQPMNANLGLLPPIDPPIRDKRDRHLALVARGIASVRALVPDL